MSELQGKRALVVGGSGGIGAAVSRSLAGAGAATTVHGGPDSGRAAALCEELAEAGLSAHPLELALGGKDPLMAERIEPLLEVCDRADILVVAYGPILERPTDRTSHVEWFRLVSANLALPGALVSRALGGMAERGYGRIVLFGGTRTSQIRPYQSVVAYSSAKTGLGVLAKSVAEHFGERNIRCNVLCPGYVRTGYLSERDETRYRKHRGFTGFQRPDTIASFVLDLCAGSGTALNGALVDIPANSDTMIEV
jgi:NAD(P)-dependent dehydrogenase (short-subunit alcohol dehydrogenase family)